MTVDDLHTQSTSTHLSLPKRWPVSIRSFIVPSTSAPPKRSPSSAMYFTASVFPAAQHWFFFQGGILCEQLVIDIHMLVILKKLVMMPMMSEKSKAGHCFNHNFHSPNEFPDLGRALSVWKANRVRGKWLCFTPKVIRLYQTYWT